jgi:hypothetical protein
LRRHAGRAGSSVLAALAGISVIGAGTTAAALARTHQAAVHAPMAQLMTQPMSQPMAQCQSLCVSVSSAGTVAAGQTASFGIRVSPSSVLDQVTVQISVASSGSPSFPAPAFTSCGSGDGTQTCTVGLLQAGQATDLAASVRVPGSAPGGETATLSATVSWTLLGLIGTGSATGSGTVDVARTPPPPPPPPPPHTPPPSTPPPGGGHPSPSPPPTGGSSPGGSSPGGSSRSGGHQGSSSPGRGQPQPLGPGSLKLGLGPEPMGLALGPLPGSVADGNDSDLFPLIKPLPATAGPSQPRRAAAGHIAYRATAAAEILPLDMRQLGVQVAGLIVLALGILIAVVRVPLRRRRARR